MTNTQKIESNKESVNEFIQKLEESIKNSTNPESKPKEVLAELLELEYDTFYNEDSLNKITEELKFKKILQEGGGEGGSENVYIVFSALDKFFSTHCSYYSNCGFETAYLLEDIREVHPEERTVTVYV